MLFSMSNNHWTEIKMMFNAVDKSLIKLHRKRHPKCMAYPNLVSREAKGGRTLVPVSPELQSGTTSPQGLKKKFRETGETWAEGLCQDCGSEHQGGTRPHPSYEEVGKQEDFKSLLAN